MSSAWLLPEHVADVLPSQARHIEELRRALLDVARSYGCELVMPPLIEHLDALLSGTGQALNLKTFKLVDQLSGRTLGVRADTTPQVARIDAHLLNRQGVTRLCYCGPVLHTRPASLHATREPLQFGAEIYGHAGLEADLEVLDLALDGLLSVGMKAVTLDLGDSRIVRALVSAAQLSAATTSELIAALAAKDASAVRDLTASCDPTLGLAMQALLKLYGSLHVLDDAAKVLPPLPLIQSALHDMRSLAAHVQRAHPQVTLSVDLADVGGYAYYSGARFAVYTAGSSSALLRGGRYDEVGAVFGRNRPAVGFSLDLKELAALLPAHQGAAAIRAPWSGDPALRSAVRELRKQGLTVVCILPGHEHEGEEFACDRELVSRDGQWRVQAL
ncbi:MAG: phosphoribosyltransferase regulatory subunit [Pseudomonadota bacterium]|jgi:ATP phosphoribosyltransferase regulatory subunit